MTKEEAKELICKAIDNIPDYAIIEDCYTVHKYGSSEAIICIEIGLNDKTEENIADFHCIAHNAFSTGMGSCS